jgi:hypothetical protein
VSFTPFTLLAPLAEAGADALLPSSLPRSQQRLRMLDWLRRLATRSFVQDSDAPA